MAETQQTPRRKISLEQLIQLKRTERPDASFWEDFDRELHRRQLAALVIIEPWHRRVERALATCARRAAPAAAGVTAVALAALALLRVGSTEHNGATEPFTVAEHDARVVLLPEEAISVSTISTPAVQTPEAREEFRGNIRSAPQELGSGLASARRFVAVSAPVTFSSESDTSANYAARTLTAGTVLRSITSAAPESL